MALNTLYLPIYLSSAVQVLEKNVNVNRFAFVSLSSLLSGLPDPFPRISSVSPFLSTRSLISMIILKNYLFSSVSVCIVIVLRRFLFSRCVWRVERNRFFIHISTPLSGLLIVSLLLLSILSIFRVENVCAFNLIQSNPIQFHSIQLNSVLSLSFSFNFSLPEIQVPSAALFECSLAHLHFARHFLNLLVQSFFSPFRQWYLLLRAKHSWNMYSIWKVHLKQANEMDHRRAEKWMQTRKREREKRKSTHTKPRTEWERRAAEKKIKNNPKNTSASRNNSWQELQLINIAWVYFSAD